MSFEIASFFLPINLFSWNIEAFMIKTKSVINVIKK